MCGTGVMVSNSRHKVRGSSRHVINLVDTWPARAPSDPSGESLRDSDD